MVSLQPRCHRSFDIILACTFTSAVEEASCFVHNCTLVVVLLHINHVFCVSLYTSLCYWYYKVCGAPAVPHVLLYQGQLSIGKAAATCKQR